MRTVTGWWESGRTLAERGRLPAPTSVPDRRARTKLDRWRTVCDLSARLARAGLDEAGLLALLAGGQPGEKPRWALEVERLTVTPRQADGLAWQDAFGLLVEPFLPDRLPERVRDGLRLTLTRIAVRVLVLELNVAAVTGTAGSVAEFVEGLDLATLFAEYPVLARLLWQRAETTARACDEMMRRFAADRADIGRLLGADPGPVTRVETGLGDTHAGRAVAILHCAHGTVVYRPRPPAVQARFNQVVEWFGGIEPELAARTVRVLDRGEYGWAEFVVARPAPDAAARGRYFRRYGALVALLHVLDGTDQHFENVVACADHPVLVDLETLFHPPRQGVDDPAATALASSVLRTCLVPQQVDGFDLSGLGGEPGAELPDDEVRFAEAGTARMRLVRARGVCEGADNRVGADPGAHVEDVVAGFRRAYQAITAHRDSLTALLAGFRDVGVRVIVRHTRDYARLLDESTHPDVLRDALDRDRLFDHLWPGAEHERLVEHEIADLWAGDVPLFSTTPGSRDLVTSTGVRVEYVFAETGLERAARKIAALGPEDLRIQEWIIRAAFTTRSAGQDLVGTCAIGDGAGLGLVRSGDGWVIAPVAPGEGHPARDEGGRDVGERVGAVVEGPGGPMGVRDR